MPEPTPNNNRKRILIVDDQPFMIRLIQFNLKRQGYETVTETDGLKALENIEKIRPDMIILDIRMPKISGTDLCRKFREQDITKDTPILILTGQLNTNEDSKAEEFGATDFMTKPFSPSELANIVNKYI